MCALHTSHMVDSLHDDNKRGIFSKKPSGLQLRAHIGSIFQQEVIKSMSAPLGCDACPSQLIHTDFVWFPW